MQEGDDELIDIRLRALKATLRRFLEKNRAPAREAEPCVHPARQMNAVSLPGENHAAS